MSRRDDSAGSGERKLTTREIRMRGASALGSPSRKELGKRLTTLRHNAGFETRGDFVLAAGMNLSTYRNYEYGMASMTYTVIWDVSKTLGITPNELLGFDVDPEREKALLTPRLDATVENPVELTRKAMKPGSDEGDVLVAIQALLDVAAKKRAGWIGEGNVGED